MVRRVAMGFGIVFLVLGIVGLVSAGGMDMGADPAPAIVLGMFPVNMLHNIVHLLFGVWGLVASRSFAKSKLYAQVGGVVYLVLALCGLFIPTTFGLIPIGGNDIWLHALIGIVLVGAAVTAKDSMSSPMPASSA